MIKNDLTVVICAYNSENYIAETLDSILHQTFKEFDLLIIDDFSTDKTIEIIKKKLQNTFLCSYKIISLNVNKGLANARKIAMEYAKTKYMMYIDSDDLMYPNMIYKLKSKISSDKNLMAVGCYSEYIDNTSKKIGGGIFIGPTTKEEFYKKAKLEKLMFINTSAIFNREIALTIGGKSIEGFPEGKIRYQDFCEDLDMWTRMSDLYLEGKAIIVIPEALLKYRKMNNTVSSNTLAMIQRMKHIKTNLKRRRKGEIELSFIEFIEQLSNEEKKKIEKEASAAIDFRKVAFNYKDKKYIKATFQAIKIMVKNPKYTLKKILPSIKNILIK